MIFRVGVGESDFAALRRSGKYYVDKTAVMYELVVDKEFCKIVIANPGTFRIGIDEAIAGDISDARNGKIFNMFALINVGERSGTGICDVYHIWAENGFKEPSYVETVDPDRIVLTLQMDPYDNGDDGNNDGNDGSLTQNEIYVLQVISKMPALSASKIAAATGISKPSVERALRSLKEKKYIRREGSTRGRWIILKERYRRV